MNIHPQTSEAFQLLMKGTLALARAERQGIRIDMEYVNRKKQQLTNKIENLEEEFRETQFFKDWQRSSRTPINIGSNPQLAKYLYEVKGIKIQKETKTGKGSTDEKALKQMGIPELDYLIKIGQLEKIRDTYLDGYTREQVDGYLHPFFNLNTVVTYRSSSSQPNFQNIPKRDEYAMQTVRSAMFPRPGHQLLEIDYSGVEVRINGAINQDKNLIRYINDPTTDMHRDVAIQLFKLDEYDEKIEGHKLLRQAAKNGFVFPQFYGDWYKSCTENVACNWGELPKSKWKAGQGVRLNGGTISDHLISKGITSFEQFTQHLKVMEADLWQNRFPEYAKWKDLYFAKYQKTGYIDLLTGFRCQGVMNKKQVCNYPGQNGGFMCLLWSFIEADRIMVEEQWDTKLIGQIHDSILLDVLPSELDHVVKTLYRITCRDLPKAWKWLNVPLDIDMELCKVDQPWSKKEKYKFK
ncbi:MAG: DNA polymerase [Candidatus Paceibacterota bacterium]|jgi:DNA polymerase-1